MTKRRLNTVSSISVEKEIDELSQLKWAGEPADVIDFIVDGTSDDENDKEKTE